MSLSRTLATARLELRTNLRRPMFWILMLILALTTWGLSTGGLTISSGASQVGGDKAWINSEFAITQLLVLVVFLLYSFFASIAGGTAVINDDEHQVQELLHSTPLRPAEYVWGKFLGVLASFALVLAIQLLLTILFFQFYPTDNADEIRGPLRLAAYLRPALLFSAPSILFFTGTAFAIGERSRRPIVVSLLPVAVVVLCVLFLWSWSPSWLDPRINRLLQILEPSGFRWLNETWLKVDRGVAFYNQQPVGLDAAFWIGRLWLVVVGIGSVALSVPHVAAVATGRATRKLKKARRGSLAAAKDESAAAPATNEPLRELGMTSAPVSLWQGVLEVTRTELRELRGQPGLYLFVPLILLQIWSAATFAVGAFDTPLLLTSGGLAVSSMNTITLVVCLLLLFYTVESLYREMSTGFGSIVYATPLRTASLLFGKALANSVVGVVIVLAAFIACAITLVVQGQTPLQLGPFILVWGLLLVPTFLIWTAFITMVLALVRNRWTTYGIVLAALIASGYFQFRGKMTWAWNWNLWNVVQWSDMGTFELIRSQLVLNRILALLMTACFTAVAVRLFGRRDFDHARILHRLHPSRAWRPALKIATVFALPLILGVVLAVQARQGFQGPVVERKQKDYWRQNLATWNDWEPPAVTAIDIELDLNPDRRRIDSQGTLTLFNHLEEPLHELVVTGSNAWEDTSWAIDGQPFEPEDKSKLFLFELDQPLLPGERLELGFHQTSSFPRGATKNGGGAANFVLPSGIVLTAFNTAMIPLPGYMEQIGVDEDNQYEPRTYSSDRYKEVLPPAFGSPLPFTTRVLVTAPAEYTINSVGTLTAERTDGDRKTVVWESDYPVKIINVVAGKWNVRREGGTAVFYHPEHEYNIDEISEGLQAARKYYSEWFHPFPWNELKLSEFPALAGYAQGFPTNITFSEGIGFLTKSDPRSNAAFMVTAHEAAHQWWGNLVTPGLGPGGNIISEGMSHYSTILLTQQVKGERDRIELCRRLEERYGDQRNVDSERPMVKIDGSRNGDGTVTYDKGGWVMWMLHNLMGRDNALAGLQEFQTRYIPGPDHPLLEDLVETLRPHAPDVGAFDAFVEQWFFDVVVPEYRFSEPSKQQEGDRWRVQVEVENIGTGRMPVVVAAQSGERWLDEEDGERTGPARPSPDFEETRELVTLDAGEATTVNFLVDFEPERIVIDPDAMVLQLMRENAIVRF